MCAVIVDFVSPIIGWQLSVTPLLAAPRETCMMPPWQCQLSTSLLHISIILMLIHNMLVGMIDVVVHVDVVEI